MYENVRKTSLALTLALLTLPMAPVHAQAPADAQHQSAMWRSPFLAQVRQATAPYRDINVAAQAGWVGRDPFCVSGENQGGMGVHVANPALLMGGNQPEVSQPQVLIYEPEADGSMRLVGVEYVVIAALWDAKHPDHSTPSVGGQLMDLITAPNRYGLPAVYSLHAWAWRYNPKGAFAQWNPNVTCEKQPLPPMS